jgi:Clp amino terminal domain, pathogenicity island component
MYHSLMLRGYDDTAKVAIADAHEEARRHGVSTGPLHLLLGVLRTSPLMASVFADYGIFSIDVEHTLDRDAHLVATEHDEERWTVEAAAVLAMSILESSSLGGGVTRVEHLALAVTNASSGESARMIESLGAPLAVIRGRLLAILGSTRTDPSPRWPEPTPHDSQSGPGGCASPEVAALRGFAPTSGAKVIDIRFENQDHAVVQVSFPCKEAYYFINAFRFRDEWRLDIPYGIDS